MPPPASDEFDARRRDLISPCIGVCMLDDQGLYCRGCYRSMDEIAGWVMMPRERRREVLDAVDERRRAAGACRPRTTLP